MNYMGERMFYDFVCENRNCEQSLITIYQRINEEHKTICPACGEKARRIYHPKEFRIDFKAGYDPGLGEYVDTSSQRADIVAKNNLRRVKD